MMRVSIKLISLCLVSLVLLSASGCKEEKKSETKSSTAVLAPATTRPAEKVSSLEEYQNIPIQPTYSNSDADAVLRAWMETATTMLVVVDSEAPKWMPNYLRKLHERHPYLTVLLVTDKRYDPEEYSFTRFVQDLHTSYVIVDQRLVMINPLYAASSKGLAHLQTNPKIVGDYLEYTTWLTGIRLR